MTIYVTQGHEKGIGLEVFFKSCLMMTRARLEQFTLVAFEDAVQDTLNSMKLPFTIDRHGVSVAGPYVKCDWLTSIDHSQSFSTLKYAMKKCEKSGVLFTLPTSKDQFPGFPGHTEYFRHQYKRQDLGMFFSAPGLKTLLLSDHIPVNKLSEHLTEDVLHERLATSISAMQRWGMPIKRILISGFNPHAGEAGLIGNEDSRISNVIHRLRKKTQLDMSGPLPGDTMYLEKRSPDDLLVYVFHDQGLGVFKSLQGFVGANITLGLPYPRVSPDHGTSFGLYGLNRADYRGCEFALREAEALLKKAMHGKDSSNKSQSSQS